jgi:ATP-dependent helicase/nuclease subunit B
MRLCSIAPNLPFLDTLAGRWLAAHAEPSRGMLLLPTRRAARALAEAFLRATGGRPLLLPRITALGALDEAPLELAGALDLPPAIEPMHRLAELSRLVLALPAEDGGAGTADRAWMLAGELAALMDEAERAELDLPAALAGAADAAHAEHWRITLRFLDIVTRAWPAWLAEVGMMNPAARAVALLRAQARAWEERPPADPVWIAGTTAAIPAVAALLRAVAWSPNGLVVLPGLDADLPEDAWEALDDSHPQAAQRHLLAGLGATRADVVAWDAPPAAPVGRVDALRRALLPAAALGAWRAPAATPDLTGLRRLAPADAQEEAVAIAMLLRDALEIPGHRAALVTPDRALAGRVAAELLRWDVVADDSAGERLGDTPPAVFLRLLARAVEARLAPLALLALLKHPLAAAGLSPAACRAATRELERAALRGPRPPPGLTGLRERLDDAAHAPDAARRLLDRLEAAIGPALRVAASVEAAPADALAALIASAEALAATDTEPGPARLWAHEEGEALAALLAEALDALPRLPDQPPSALPGLLDALLEGAVARSRRALRGRDATAEHPRVFIWGLLEARLQTVDVIVLGGLAEGVWPPATDPGPWLSRPMRKAAGLPSPEERVGLAAHDFVAAACAAPVAVLSCPRRRDGAPAVPSRWLTRLDAMLAGRALTPPAHPATAWARALDLPARVMPAARPRPRPPLGLRPRRLSVTEIETLLADPFAIYARHVLRLRPLDPLEQETDAIDYGSLVHRALEIFLRDHGATWPANADLTLRAAMEQALAQARVRPALAEWWLPRLYRIADWVAEHERDRRAAAAPERIVPELLGAWAVPGRDFVLRGRADRIERYAGGRLAILDYKTGAPPSRKEVEAGFAPQLPLEAAMAEAGGFGADLVGRVTELTYWHLTGGFVPGEARTLFNADATRIAEAVRAAEAGLRELIAKFDDPTTPYLSVPHPGRAPRFSDYAQLARRSEWADAGEEG